MIISTRAWLEDFSSSLHALAVFSIAYRRRIFARKRRGAPPLTRIERQNEDASTLTALWSTSFRLMTLTRESNEVEWDNYFGLRMSVVIERVSNIVGDVPVLSSEFGPMAPTWEVFKPYAKWLAERARIRTLVSAARHVRMYLQQPMFDIPSVSANAPGKPSGQNAKDSTTTKTKKEPKRRGRKQGINYINLALTELTARMKDDRPIGIPDLARAVGCTPENLNQSKRFRKQYRLLTRALDRVPRGRKDGGRIEAEDMDGPNF